MHSMIYSAPVIAENIDFSVYWLRADSDAAIRSAEISAVDLPQKIQQKIIIISLSVILFKTAPPLYNYIYYTIMRIDCPEKRLHLSHGSSDIFHLHHTAEYDKIIIETQGGI